MAQLGHWRPTQLGTQPAPPDMPTGQVTPPATLPAQQKMSPEETMKWFRARQGPQGGINLGGKTCVPHLGGVVGIPAKGYYIQ